MPSPKTRRYSIEIKDPDNKPVLFTAVDWTDEERLIAVAQIMRLAGLSDDIWSPGDKPGERCPSPIALEGSAADPCRSIPIGPGRRKRQVRVSARRITFWLARRADPGRPRPLGRQANLPAVEA